MIPSLSQGLSLLIVAYFIAYNVPITVGTGNEVCSVL